jgi:tRNA G18 (ribose-2'-O)-methylase SpoU
MPTIRIDTEDDPRIALYRDLPNSNSRFCPQRFIVEGRLLVERLVNSEYAVESLLVDERHPELVPERLAPEVPVYTAPAELLSGVLGFKFHRGVLACGLRKTQETLADTIAKAGSACTVVVCVGVQDPINLGGILRNCLAFGVQVVLLAPPCADPFSRRVSRVSMGAVFKLNLVPVTDLMAELQCLHQEHLFELAATVLNEDAEDLATAARPQRLALLFGNEGYGLNADVVDLCQRQVNIPMCCGTDSLNASVASGVFLYHFTRVARG